MTHLRSNKPLRPELLERLGGIPHWLDRASPIKPCRDCGEPIRLITATDTAMTRRPFVVDAAPMYSGWVRVYLRDRAASFRPMRTGPGATAGDDPYLSFQTHSCAEHLEAKRARRLEAQP